MICPVCPMSGEVVTERSAENKSKEAICGSAKLVKQKTKRVYQNKMWDAARFYRIRRVM
jgi:hypothetical protein